MRITRRTCRTCSSLQLQKGLSLGFEAVGRTCSSRSLSSRCGCSTAFCNGHHHPRRRHGLSATLVLSVHTCSVMEAQGPHMGNPPSRIELSV